MSEMVKMLTIVLTNQDDIFRNQRLIKDGTEDIKEHAIIIEEGLANLNGKMKTILGMVLSLDISDDAKTGKVVGKRKQQ